MITFLDPILRFKDIVFKWSIWIGFNVMTVKLIYDTSLTHYNKNKQEYNFIVEKRNILIKGVIENFDKNDPAVLDLLKDITNIKSLD